jgi:hypothetical protein
VFGAAGDEMAASSAHFDMSISSMVLSALLASIGSMVARWPTLRGSGACRRLQETVSKSRNDSGLW